jgi:hypothetical protein
VPVLFVVVEKLVHRERAHAAPPAAAPSPVAGGSE